MHKWVWASFTTAVAGCYSLHIKSWQPLPVAIEFLKLPGAPDGVDAQMVMQSNKKKKPAQHPVKPAQHPVMF